MSFFNFFKTSKMDINEGVQQYKQEADAMLIDVRTEEEYQQGHIEDSVNIPLSTIGSANQKLKDFSGPLYVYCFSGARSRQAVSALKTMGYTKVKNIGGINQYRGKVVR